MTIEKIETPTGSVIHTQIIRGTVISINTRTEFTTKRDSDTYIGNGKMLPGQVYNEASTVRDIWLRTDDAKEMKLPFGGLGLAMRDGHSVAFIYAKDHKGEPRCLASKNFTTGESIVSTENSVRIAGESVSNPPKLPMGAWVQVPTMLVVSYFATLIETKGGFSFGVFFFSIVCCLFVMATLSVIRHNSRNKRAGGEAAEILRGRVEALPAP
ncbi:MAG: hypothetical protein Q8S92_15500 [Hydrogenophaga sp.]|uniref:hypothetical protein n=1 Tax=Hydrogenophaga sp. TaxID=1904254 RepID=UPI0027363D71|nr:hypothetical protein [Hydrogenophaga sp.]MDP3350395.1 hypothetical protein [Hydrogenophaga sp.]